MHNEKVLPFRRPAAKEVAELRAGESWLEHAASRGNVAAPSMPLPARYEVLVRSMRSAVAGDGSRQAIHDLVGLCRALLVDLRREHDRLLASSDSRIIRLADLALRRVAANLGDPDDPDCFPGGASHLDRVRVLLGIWTAAGEEVSEATAAGYVLPAELRTLAAQAQSRLKRAKIGRNGELPDAAVFVSPSDEQELADFHTYASSLLGQMRTRRVADVLATAGAEAAALDDTAAGHLIRLCAAIADRRRHAFASEIPKGLDGLHSALVEITLAVEEVQAAARFITMQVSRPAPNSLAIPVDLLRQIHGRVDKAMVQLDLRRLCGDGLDSGWQYLKQPVHTMKHFAGSNVHPYVRTYVDNCLGPICVTAYDHLNDNWRSVTPGGA